SCDTPALPTRRSSDLDQGQLVFGPTAAAAQLETSKAFMKAFCLRHGIRTARHAQVNLIAELPAALASFANPPVVKASGLCAGKRSEEHTSALQSRENL